MRRCVSEKGGGGSDTGGMDSAELGALIDERAVVLRYPILGDRKCVVGDAVVAQTLRVARAW